MAERPILAAQAKCYNCEHQTQQREHHDFRSESLRGEVKDRKTCIA